MTVPGELKGAALSCVSSLLQQKGPLGWGWRETSVADATRAGRASCKHSLCRQIPLRVRPRRLGAGGADCHPAPAAADSGRPKEGVESRSRSWHKCTAPSQWLPSQQVQRIDPAAGMLRHDCNLWIAAARAVSLGRWVGRLGSGQTERSDAIFGISTGRLELSLNGPPCAVRCSAGVGWKTGRGAPRHQRGSTPMQPAGQEPLPVCASMSATDYGSDETLG